jgi:hypothetical protein
LSVELLVLREVVPPQQQKNGKCAAHTLATVTTNDQACRLGAGYLFALLGSEPALLLGPETALLLSSETALLRTSK